MLTTFLTVPLPCRGWNMIFLIVYSLVLVVIVCSFSAFHMILNVENAFIPCLLLNIAIFFSVFPSINRSLYPPLPRSLFFFSFSLSLSLSLALSLYPSLPRSLSLSLFLSLSYSSAICILRYLSPSLFHSHIFSKKNPHAARKDTACILAAGESFQRDINREEKGYLTVSDSFHITQKREKKWKRKNIKFHVVM